MTSPVLRYEAAIFDLGGVFIDWNPRNLYRKLFPDDDEAMERFLAEVTTAEWNHQLDAGRPFAEAIAELQQAHPEHADLIAAYWDRWPEMLGEVNSDTAEIVIALRGRGLRVYALSNWSAETYPRTTALAPELSVFDDVQLSGEVKVAKPDPRAFRIATDRFQVEPARTLFVDDMAANVEAANAIGFTAIQFIDAPALRRALAELGVLDTLT